MKANKIVVFVFILALLAMIIAASTLIARADIDPLSSPLPPPLGDPLLKEPAVRSAGRVESPAAPVESPQAQPEPEPAVSCIVGKLSHYAQRPTDAVLRNRSTPGRTAYTLPEVRGVDGYIAGQRCQDIGKVWTVHYQGRSARLMVFDCPSDRATAEWMRRGNVIGELGYYIAREWGVVGRAVEGVVCE